jgi:3-deoxy-7-phosphoheptulonate synthase
MKDIDLTMLHTKCPRVFDAKHFEVPRLIAGPCRIESEDMGTKVADALTKMGINHMRAGAFKPCTFPDDPKGTGYDGLDWLSKIRLTGMGITTEFMNLSQLGWIDDVDIVQIGARNMQNYDFLKAVGIRCKHIALNSPHSREPMVMLKRHPGASLRDFLGAAEWLLASGANKVILCDRGCVAPNTHHPKARWMQDLQIIPAIRNLCQLPLIIDPSHATGYEPFVLPMARAAIAAGADGVMIEAHPTPRESVSDADQALSIEQLSEFKDWLDRYDRLME